MTTSTTQLSGVETVIGRLESQRRTYSLLILIFFLFLVIAGVFIANDLNSGSLANGFGQFFDFPMRFAVEIGEAGWPKLVFDGFAFPSFAPGCEETDSGCWGFLGLASQYWAPLFETVNVALVSTLLGTLLAILYSLISTRNIGVWPPLIPITRRIMDVSRAFPDIVIALLLIYIFGSNALPGIIAIMIHSSGALGKLFSEVNENIDHRPIDGLRATGAGWLQRVRYAILPQVAPNYLSYMLLRLEINVRASAILGFVGAGGIGAELSRSIKWGIGEYANAGMILLMLFITIVVIDQISSHLRGLLTDAEGAR